jgi:small-conductance mechanosensitive channel
MENLNQKHSVYFRGAGWLLGLMVSIVSALVVFTLSDNFLAAVAAGIPLVIFSGLSLENKLQSLDEPHERSKSKVMIGISVIGFIVFTALYIKFKLL